MGKIAFCFPGQGALEAGMGREIAEAVPAAMDVYRVGSEASGLDLQKLCFDSPLEELVDTEVQQPALVATCLAILAAIREARARAGRRRRPLGRRVLGARVGRRDRHGRGDRRSCASAGSRWPRRPASTRARWPRSSVSRTRPSRRCAARSSASGPRTTTARARSSSPARTMQLRSCCAEAESLGARRAIKLKVSGAFHSPLVAQRRRAAAAGDRHDPLPRPDRAVHVDRDGARRAGDPARLAARRPADGAGQVHAGRARARARRRHDVRRGRARATCSPGLVKRIDRSVRTFSVNDLASLEKAREALSS